MNEAVGAIKKTYASVIYDSLQDAPCHMKRATYGCFLSDLTGFASVPLSRTQPSTPRAPNLTKGQTALRWEFNLAKADCELQDTANFPSSAGKIHNSTLYWKTLAYHTDPK